MPDHSYFLSAENPIANVDQFAIEDRALRLLKRPALERARSIATVLWKNAVAWPARDQMSRFDNMIDEYVFHYAMRAANGDAHRPQIARFMAPPHRWNGRDIPGSRWAGDSPDFIYRIIPIAHGGAYEIHGRPTCERPPTATYSLMADTNAAPVTLALLDSLDMSTEANGEFEITLDPDPANGRTNHIQTKPGADHLMIRDALGDWLNQSPNALRVRRLDDVHVDRPSDDNLAERAAKNLIEGFYYTYYCTQSGAGQAPNEVRPPQSSGTFGGMATQWGTKGNLVLEDDEVLIVTASAAGAGFRNVTLTDCFHMSFDYWFRTTSLNMVQMAADADGRFTYVVAHRDPGIYNWLDTSGLRRTIFGQRWQAFARGHTAETPMLSARKAKFDALDIELPAGVLRIDAAGRRDQIAKREAGYRRRFLDH